jgi:hypothetical protein
MLLPRPEQYEGIAPHGAKNQQAEKASYHETWRKPGEGNRDPSVVDCGA